MSNDVQSHEAVAERVAGEERRAGLRHAAQSLGSVTARIIGGSQVDLVNFSSRGVLFECDSRLLIGARASVRITTTDANIIVSGRVVRSRVKGLVNGALRYDAALVLDSELALAPAIMHAAPGAADDLEFESAFEDPSPVEAYLAESEASLLEVAGESVLPGSLVEAAAATAAEPPPAALDAGTALDAVEPVAFEADTDIAFEPAVEFAFDEFSEAPAGEPVEPVPADVIVAERIVIDEGAGTSMFDATYIPPTYEPEASAEPLFEVTPPMPVADAPASSSPFFDASPSEGYGDAVAESVDFETEVAFEAVDAVMFEPSFDEAPAEPSAPAESPDEALAAAPDEPLAAVPDDTLAAEPAEPLADEADDIDMPAAVPDTADRVLLQFAATVPHDLAELRRIAADNQW